MSANNNPPEDSTYEKWKWTIGQKLWLLAILNIVLLITIQVINLHSINELKSKLKILGSSELPAVRDMTLSDMMHDGIRAVIYRALYAKSLSDQKELEASVEELKEFTQNIVNYLESINKYDLNHEIKAAIAEAMPPVKKYVEVSHQVVESLKIQKESGLNSSTDIHLSQFNESFEELEEKLGKLGELIEKDAQLQVASSEESARKTVVVSLVALLAAMVIGFSMSIWININLLNSLKSFVLRLKNQGHSLKEYTEKIDDSSVSLSRIAGQQLTAIVQTSTAVKEINEMIEKTSKESESLLDTSNQSQNLVRKGKQIVAKMAAEMESIQKSNHSMEERFHEGQKNIEEIITIINQITEKANLINDIVFQTKLLAFNASVEAARAGENGKGFSVVAEEVGNLAAMSGNAAASIREILQAGTGRVNEIVADNKAKIESIILTNSRQIAQGQKTVVDCGGIFEQIVEQTTGVAKMSEEMTMAISEQKNGLGEIDRAIAQFNQGAVVNSETAKQTQGVSSELHESFLELEMLVQEVGDMVTGAQSAGPNKQVA